MAEGGHHIPRDVIVRRYWAGLRDMTALYLPLADTAKIFDNSDEPAVLIASKTRDAGMMVHDRPRWTRLQRMSDEGHDGLELLDAIHSAVMTVSERFRVKREAEERAKAETPPPVPETHEPG